MGWFLFYYFLIRAYFRHLLRVVPTRHAAMQKLKTLWQWFFFKHNGLCGQAICSSQLLQVDTTSRQKELAIFTIHGQEVLHDKIILQVSFDSSMENILRWMETNLKLTKRCLVYGWATKSSSVKTNKKISEAQRGSQHDNTTNERKRQTSTVQKKSRTHWQIQLIFIQRNKYRAQISVYV